MKRIGQVLLVLFLAVACKKTGEQQEWRYPTKGPHIFEIEYFSDILHFNAIADNGNQTLTCNNLRLEVAPMYLSDDARCCLEEGEKTVFVRYPATFLLQDFDSLVHAAESEDFLSFKRQLHERVHQSIQDSGKNVFEASDGLRLVYAGIAAAPVITADKTLFGIPPGGDLTDYFAVTGMGSASQYLVSYPGLSFEAFYGDMQAPVPVKEIYRPGVTLPSEVILGLSTIPQERYDHLTLTIQIPILALSTFTFSNVWKEGMKKEVELTLSGAVTLDF